MSEHPRFTRRYLLHSVGLGAPFALASWSTLAASNAPAPAAALELQRIADGKPRNIIFILTDELDSARDAAWIWAE